MKYTINIPVSLILSSLCISCFLISKVSGAGPADTVVSSPPSVSVNAEDLNLAPDVSEDYPVVFNIILFLAISLILALIAISVALSTMDPGRDSLIYRVTSAQRFKKDN